MKTKIVTILAAVILFVAGEGWATNISFYEDGVIQEGDVYDYVGVFNDATVDMTGGIVTIVLSANDQSTVNVSGGVLGRLGSGEFSTLNLSGDMETNELEVHNSSTMNMFSGNVGLMQVGSSNPVNLHGGVISDYLKAVSTVNIYGYGFEYNPLAGNYRGGQLTGFWLDDTPFSIDLYYDDTPGGPIIDTWSHIVLIPEPATILLFGLGTLILKARI